MSDIVPEKKCSACGQFYPPTTEYFRKASKEKSGLTSRCKLCLHKGDAKYRKENPDAGKQWYEDNKDRLRAEYKEMYWSDPQKFRDIQRERYKKNPEPRKKAAKEYREKYPEKVRATQKVIYIRKRNDPEWWAAELLRIADYYKRHPEKKREQSHKAYHNHKDKRRDWARQDYIMHPEKARAKHYKRVARLKQVGGTYTASDLMQLYEEQEHRCLYCGQGIFWSIKRDIHVDHIYPISKGGSNWPDNLALTCHSCNESKADKLLEEWVQVRGW